MLITPLTEILNVPTISLVTACSLTQGKQLPMVLVAGGCISIIFISNGCVATCNLFIPGTTGSGTHINRVKKIGIWPLNEEFDALTAYFGAVYSVSQFYCSFFGDILTFQMQKEILTSSSNHSGPSCTSLPTFFSYCPSLIKIT